ncbi:MAG: glycosyltransferase family 2 protein [Candidatus Omnitrophica bacterium]|nr:glycosyltransferase family 2 protein [Candidatus Omnitrophota bacterium]
MNLCVIIPTYNEAKHISKIIKEILKYNLKVLVIDDGSKDDTYKIASLCGAEVIRKQRNEGKGSCLRIGFDYALKNNFDGVITMDGDGQHLPKEIIKFIQRAEESDNSIFIGNRMFKPLNMPLIRRLTNLVMSSFISFIIKQKIPDTQCGFRLIKRKLLEKIKLSTSHYETDTEIIIIASKMGYKIESIPIESVYSGQKTYINPIIDTLRFVWLILKQYIKNNGL